MARVYVSSTLADLKEERQAVMDWLVDAGHLPVHSYVADTETVRDSCLADIDGCDVYLLILGFRFGFVPATDNAEGLSITQLEYRRARQRPMPCVALLQTSAKDMALTDFGNAERARKVEAFRAEVSEAGRAAQFHDIASLMRQLSNGIQRALDRCGSTPSAATAAQPVPAPLLRRPLHPIVGRDQLVLELLEGLKAGQRHFAFEYLPGVGKTALAAKLVRHEPIRRLFPDGILWAHLGDDPDLRRELEKWAHALHLPDDEVRGCAAPAALSGLIARRIADRRMLLVIDDVWSFEAGQLFDIAGDSGACVLTTRNGQVARDIAPVQGVIRVRKLDEDDSIALLRAMAPDAETLVPGVLRQLAGHVDGLPIGLVLVGNRLKRARSARAVREIVQSVGVIYGQDKPVDHQDHADASGRARDRHLDELIEDSYKNLGRSGALNADVLDGDTLRGALQALSVLRPDPAWFGLPLASVVTEAPERVLDDLADAGLIERYEDGEGPGAAAAGERYTMHRVIAAYIRKKLPEAQFRRLNRRAADHYLEEMQVLEERYQSEGSNYRAMYRYEDPQWTHCQDNWLYYLARTEQGALGSLAFLRAWFDGFWWWSCFTDEGFDFCDQLLREWDHRLRLARSAGEDALGARSRQRTDRSTLGLDLLRRFKQSYPKEFPRGGGRQGGSWEVVAQTLTELRQLVDIDGAPSALSLDDARKVRALTDVFLAEAARFGGRDVAAAESHYREALQLLRDADDDWNVAWLLYHLADMFCACGRDAEVEPLCDEGLAIGLDPEGGHPDLEVLSQLHRVMGDAALHAGRFDDACRRYALAVELAYRFQVEPQDPDEYTVQFYADIAQHVSVQLIAAQRSQPHEAATVARRLRLGWLERGAELAALDAGEAAAAAGADVLARQLFPAALAPQRVAADGAPYAARVRQLLGVGPDLAATARR